MASNAPVSTPIKALLEQLGGAMAGNGQMPSPAAIYGQLMRIRDEAELLEVRASARDAKVAALLAELATAADRLERLEGVALPAVTTIAALAARRAGAQSGGARP
jgi:hypothetical protein